jgi:D-alanyl-D-alanine carboxypeptidase
MTRWLAAAVVALGLAAPRAAAAPAPAGFTFSSVEIAGTVKQRMTGRSWRPGCPVPLSGLRYLRIAHRGFDGRRRVGELVVRASVVPRMRKVFRALYRDGFRIRRMRLVDAYGASDLRSIEADNTSAFNCRRVTGGRRWSEHAYGRAIDLNPIENPYVIRGTTAHRASRPYLDRRRIRRGMAWDGGALVRAFRRVGWHWGGRWRSPTDYQHFSSSGR